MWEHKTANHINGKSFYTPGVFKRVHMVIEVRTAIRQINLEMDMLDGSFMWVPKQDFYWKSF